MTEQTDIDRAIAALSAAPEDEALNLALHARIAEAELFVVLEEEPQGETVRPTILETSTGKLALAFDREERMVAFMGDATAYVALAGRRVAVFHHEGRVHALDDTCPHQGASLGDGVISRGDVTCPFHAWHFDLVTGKNTDSLDACVAVFPTRIDAEGRVEVDLGR